MRLIVHGQESLGTCGPEDWDQCKEQLGAYETTEPRGQSPETGRHSDSTLDEHEDRDMDTELIEA